MNIAVQNMYSELLVFRSTEMKKIHSPVCVSFSTLLTSHGSASSKGQKTYQ